jgi:hypothetical protein
MQDKLEFEEFMSGREIHAPQLSELSSQIKADLKRWRILAHIKFVLILLFTGLLSLLICPQFHVGPFQDSYHYLHSLLLGSDILCGAFCAAVFCGSGMLVAQLSLDVSQKAYLRDLRYTLAIFSTGVAYGLLMLISSMGTQTHYIGTGYHLAWLGVCFFIISYYVQRFWNMQSFERAK